METQRFLPIKYPMHTRQPDNMSCNVLVCWYLNQLINSKSLEDDIDTDKFRKTIFDEIMGTSDISDNDQVIYNVAQITNWNLMIVIRSQIHNNFLNIFLAIS